MRLPIGKRKEPGANDIYSVGLLVNYQAPELVAVLGRNHTRRMIGKPGEHGHFMTRFSPVPRQLVRSRGRRTHLRWKVLRDVKNLHVTEQRFRNLQSGSSIEAGDARCAIFPLHIFHGDGHDDRLP